MSLQIPKKLRPLIEKPKRFKVAYGGRGAGKSQSFAAWFATMCHIKGMKLGCFREFQNSIEDSVYSLLTSEIRRLEIPGFNIGKATIDNTSGGKIRFKGLSRSPDSVKSMEGFNRFWVEEGQSISEDSLRMLTPTLRTKDSECWFSLNPMSSADPISQRFLEPFINRLNETGYYEDDLHLIVRINWRDNPWFPAELEKERLYDYGRLSRAEYDHVWEGAYNDTIEGALVPAEHFDAAINAHIKLGFKPQGVKVLAHDPSDEGADDKAICIRHGSVITHLETLSEGDCSTGMDWALNKALDHACDLFVWDTGGGMGLKRQVTDALDMKRIDYAVFNGGAGVDRPDEFYGDMGTDNRARTNKHSFRNKRAQYYWDMKDRFMHTYLAVEKGVYCNPDKLISISGDIQNIAAIKSEVCRVPRKFNPSGLLQVMSKPEMKKLKIKSPNMADSLMMSLFLGDYNQASETEINLAAYQDYICDSLEVDGI